MSGLPSSTSVVRLSRLRGLTRQKTRILPFSSYSQHSQFKLCTLFLAWTLAVAQQRQTRIVLCSFLRSVSPSRTLISASRRDASAAAARASVSTAFEACRSPAARAIASCACSLATSSRSSVLNSTCALFWLSSSALLARSFSSVSTLFPVQSLYLQKPSCSALDRR